MKKVVITFLFVFVFCGLIKAQYKYEFNLSVGESFSGAALSLLLPNNSVKVMPVFTTGFKAFAGDFAAFGANFSMQFYRLAQVYDSSQVSLNINRYNFTVLGYYFYKNTQKISVYSAFGVGLNVWHAKVSANLTDYFRFVAPNYYKFLDRIVEYVTSKGVNTSLVAFQFTVLGLNKHIGKRLGIYSEFVVGAPYVITFGLTYRFNSSAVSTFINE